jgi:alpha-tubulin suppressor-like RCC1 family protein
MPVGVTFRILMRRSSLGLRLYAWGENFNGQLGDGTTTDRLSPTAIGTCTWKAIAAGRWYSLGIRADNALYAWGENSSGQLGDGTTINRLSPTAIGTCTWKAIAAGTLHSLGIRADNALYAWGYNGIGQLGDGTTTNRISPTAIGTCTWKTIAAGSYHSLGIRGDDKLYAWGLNNKGQLGDGTTTQRESPTAIGTCTWKAVGAGQAHSIAIRGDNRLFAWGQGLCYQLGQGNQNSSLVPIAIGTSTWKAVTARQSNGQFDTSDPVFPDGYTDSNHAILSDDKLYAWGINSYGQLGDGTSTHRSSPTLIGTCTWKAVNSDNALGHSLGIRGDDKLYAWGNNSEGQLGDGTTIGQFSPTVIGTCTWTAIAAGMYHSLGLKEA